MYIHIHTYIHTSIYQLKQLAHTEYHKDEKEKLGHFVTDMPGSYRL